ncbi:MAG: cytochrome c family protein [Alphaproteobacteria bacterium]|nr:cytochrome c family protein [Alphaproteobacteria bacterium]
MRFRNLVSLAIAAAFTVTAGQALAEGDAVKGKKVFNKCKTCHGFDPTKKKLGPHMQGIIDRTAGTVEGFKYSDAMKDSGIVWTEETIDAYIADPKDYVPGNKMALAKIKKPEDRANVIAYIIEQQTAE